MPTQRQGQQLIPQVKMRILRHLLSRPYHKPPGDALIITDINWWIITLIDHAAAHEIETKNIVSSTYSCRA